MHDPNDTAEAEDLDDADIFETDSVANSWQDIEADAAGIPMYGPI